ncbi:MAG: hypothetical protein MJB14_00660 [Spirochaetes bacterium]|nr:hypothetical protein [Spirochaetota bacterium]
MKKNLIFMLLIFAGLSLFSKGNITWKAGAPQFVPYMTTTGKTGFITTPSAYCSPMGTLIFGHELTISSRSPVGVLAVINKVTFTPHWIFEFGFSKELAFLDSPSPHFYFDSTPFFMHYKVRFLNWNHGALAFGQDFDLVPDNSGNPSRGLMSTTIYVMFTGVTDFIGSFNFGFGKTFYFTDVPDLLFNFYISWVYSFAKLDHRLQLVLDFSNADYRAGEDLFKVAHEDRAYLNFQVRGVPVKTKQFQWTLMMTFYDLLDMGGTAVPGAVYVNFNMSIGTTFNIDLY